MTALGDGCPGGTYDIITVSRWDAMFEDPYGYHYGTEESLSCIGDTHRTIVESSPGHSMLHTII